MKLITELRVFIPDTRGVMVEARYGKGNTKIGTNVYTYSRLPGLQGRAALGFAHEGARIPEGDSHSGTCPGATDECQRICYARGPVTERGPVFAMWERNSLTDSVPPIPAEATLLRIHVSGDFNSAAYIDAWCRRLQERPDVLTWAYTRSWRVPSLLTALETIRALPNMHLFASMDKSHTDLPPAGWRRAWIDGDSRAGDPQTVRAHMDDPVTHNLTTFDGGATYVCPEETKRVLDCERCGYCFSGQKNDVTFLEH